MEDYELHLSQESGKIAGGAALDAISKLLEYYPRVLSTCLLKLSLLLEKGPNEVLQEIEESLELTGVLSSNMNQLKAGREVLGDFLGYEEEK
jgi:hypothetical protein